jgi:hypothetical protein
MPRSVLPSEDCVFRLDHRYGFNQAFPMTFNNVGLSDDGFEFDGEGSYIDCGNDSSLSISNEISISVTFTTTNSSSDEIGLVGKRNGDGLEIPFAVELVSGIPRFSFYNSSFIYVDGMNDLRDGQQHTILFTYDSNKISVYEDGINTSNKNETLPMVQNNYDVVIGSRGKGSAVRYNDSIKHVSIYNRALTAQEVADRYNEVTFQFLNDTPTPTQQNYLDFWDNRKIGRQ